MVQTRKRTTVFISYSHEDTPYLTRLQQHLTPAVRNGDIALWVDTQLQAGDEWQKEIEAALDRAQVAILLVSVSFLASEFITRKEVPTLLAAAQERGVVILPVILNHCGFRRSVLKKYQTINAPSQPLSGMDQHDQDAIWDRLVERALKALEGQQGMPRTLPGQQRRTRAVKPSGAPPPPPPVAPVQVATRPTPTVPSKVRLTMEGEQHFEARRFVEALDCYEQALEQDANYLLALRGKALALFHLNHPQDALAAARDTIRRHPEDPIAQYIKGLILAGMKRYAEALSSFDEAILLDPQYSLAHAAKIRMLAQLNRYAEVVVALEQAEALNPAENTWSQFLQDVKNSLPPGTPLLTLTEHAGTVRAVAWSPNGRLATASDDKTARVWDTASGKLIATLTGHSDSVLSAAWSPDGRRLATGGYNGEVRLWDAISGRPITAFWGHTKDVNSVVWSPNGRQLATASDDKTVRVWDSISERFVTTLNHNDCVLSIAWSPDGRHLASASSDHLIRRWDTVSGKLLATLNGHTDWVRAVAWSPDGRSLASGGSDRTVRLWDVSSGKLLTKLNHSDSVLSVAWSPDGRRVASGGNDLMVRLWDADSGKPLLTLTGHTLAVSAVAWSPDGHRLASASLDQTARVWWVGED